FTDGEPDAPPYRPCANPEVLSTFADNVRSDRFRLGVVALPTGDKSADALAVRLARLLASIGDDQATNAKNTFRIIKYRDGPDPTQSIREQIRELISSRLDLIAPRVIDLGERRHHRLSQEFTVVNKSRVLREIEIATAELHFDQIKVPVTVTPSTIRIPS